MELVKTKTGFTLIELLVAVAIIGILTLLVMPAYQQHIRSSRRTTAIAELLSIQLAESRYRAINSTYGTIAQLGIPSSDNYYDYSISNNTATDYTITATAKAGTSQTSDTADGTNCSTLTLNQDNAKTPSVCWPS